MYGGGKCRNIIFTGINTHTHRHYTCMTLPHTHTKKYHLLQKSYFLLHTPNQVQFQFQHQNKPNITLGPREFCLYILPIFRTL
jgi:hypothetical protein